MRTRRTKNVIATRACEECGKAFKFRDYESNITLGRGRFCGKRCQSKWQAVPFEARFQKYVGLKTESGCLPWTGCTNAKGYGVIGSGTQKGKMLLAHRAAFEKEAGPIPKGMLVLHKCDNPTCVNAKEHLYLGTHADNHADMATKKRGRKRVVGSRRSLQEARRAQ